MRNIGIFLKPSIMPYKEQIELISKMGFQAVFTGFYDEETQKGIAKQLDKYNLVCDTIHAPYNGINHMWLDTEEGEKMFETLRSCLECCATYEVPTMIVHLSSGVTPPPVTDLGQARYTRLIEYAAQKGITIAFENQRKLAYLAWVFEAFPDCDTVKFCWDTGHQNCCFPNVDFMRMYGDRLGALHIDDNYGVYQQDDHLIPFDGTVDFKMVADRIRTSGYAGTIMLEIERGQYKELSDEAYFEKAAKAARKLADMI